MEYKADRYMLSTAISLVSDFFVDRILGAPIDLFRRMRGATGKTNRDTKRSGPRRGDRYGNAAGRLSTHGLTTEREKRAVIRRIYTEGEAHRKACARPDDRDDKYLHSHARNMRRLARMNAANKAA